MATDKTYKSGLVITGDSRGGVRAVKLTADELKRLDDQQRRAASGAQEFAKRMRSGLESVAKWGAGIATAATAAGAAMTTSLVRQGLESADALAKTSDKLGITTEKLASLRHAAELTGVSSNKLDVAMQRMTRRIADAAAGSGPAVSAFEALGLSAEELVNLSPDEAFARIADRMNDVENQSQKVSLAFKLFDSEGVGLVNTLALGSDGLARMAEEAEVAGVALSRVDAAKVEMANDAMFRTQQLTAGFSQQLAVQFAPVLEGIAERLFGVGKEAGGMGEVAERVFRFMADAVGVVADGVNGLNLVFNGVVFGLQKLAEYWAKIWYEMAEAAVSAYNLIPFVDDIDFEQTGAAKMAKEIELSFANAAAETKKKIDGILTTPPPSDRIQAFVAETKRQYDAQAIAIVESQKKAQGEVITTQEVIESTAKKTTKTVKKETEKTSDDFSKAWEAATERVDEAFADAWKGAFDSFGDFKDRLLDAFKQLLAEMAHFAITKPILISLGLGGSATAAGNPLSALTGGSGGGTSYSGLGSLYNAATNGLGSLGTGVFGLTDAIGYGGGQLLHSLGFTNTAANFYGGMLNYQQGLIDTGSSIGSFFGADNLSANASAGVGALANIGAGYAGSWAGNALGEGLFGKEAESSWGATVGSLVGSIGGPLGTFIGGTIGSLVDVAFGGDGKKRVQVGVSTHPNPRMKYIEGLETADSGLSLGAVNIRGGSAGESASLALVDAFKAIDRALLGAFSTLQGATPDFRGVEIGLNASEARTSQYDGYFGSHAFNRVNAGQIEDAPNEFVRRWVEAANAQLGTQLDFSPIFDLAQEGELLADALIRVNTEFVTVNAAFEQMGLAALDLSIDSMAMADQIAQAFGGLESFASSAGAFISGFYTEADQFEALSTALSEQFAGLSLAIPDTREGFRSLVESMDVATAAGREQFAALVQLAPAMTQYYQALEGQTGVLDTVGSAVDDLLKQITTALSRATDDMQLPGADAERQRRASAQAFVQAQLDAGEVSDVAELERAIGILSDDSSDLFGSYVDYQRDLIRTRNNLKKLQIMLEGDDTVSLSGVSSAAATVTATATATDVNQQVSNDALVAELQALRTDNAALRDELRSMNVSVSKNTLKTYKLMLRWDVDGQPPERTA